MFRKTIADDQRWAERSGFWAEQTSVDAPVTRQTREDRPLIVLSGHGVRLHVQNGSLVVQNGFTHYPQKREEWRFFSGDWRLPSRIIVLDGKGGLTFHALRWLAERDIPLVHIDWQGKVLHVVGGNGYAIDRGLAEAQRDARTNGAGLKLCRELIAEKIANAMETLCVAFPPSPPVERASQKMGQATERLRRNPPRSFAELQLIESHAGQAYFAAWKSFPLRWKGTGRRPIPDDWARIVARKSRKSGDNRPNQFATHPMNAILNYAYAVLETQVRSHVIGAGLDPAIGFMHGLKARHQSALVYDLMEPFRPIVDRQLLDFVQRTTFTPADLTITSKGVCRLNPELARNVVRMTVAEAAASERVFASARLINSFRARTCVRLRDNRGKEKLSL
jgi:CRISP-associated protein Cas1